MDILSKRITVSYALGFGLIGATTLWFSHPPVFILAGVGGYIAISHFMRKEWAVIKIFSIAYVFWLASFGVLYFISFRVAVDAATAQQFWVGHFMPLPPSSFSEAMWFVRTFFEIPGKSGQEAGSESTLVLVLEQGLLRSPAGPCTGPTTIPWVPIPWNDSHRSN